MEKIKLEDINLLDVGVNLRLTGVIYSDVDSHILCFLPNEEDGQDSYILNMDLEDWKKFIRQTDLTEVETLVLHPNGGVVKAILRKSARNIDARITWRVFKRDNYTCRYCGAEGVPMTIDHLILWKKGGATVKGNLVTTCRKCNKIRGDMPYHQWIVSRTYLNKSKNLSQEVIAKNLDLIETIKSIPRVVHKKSR
jgi:hypothetical protein